MSISSTPFEGAIGWRSKTYAGQGFTHHTKTFRQAEDTLTEVAERFRYVQIEHRTYQELLARHDRLGTLIYLDPPYVQETRTQKKQYLCEWTKEEHRQLAEIVRACQSYIIISGYACPLYTELFEDAGWQRRDRKSQTQHGFRIESLWLNPQTSEALNLPTQTTIFDQIKT
jgi:DNA adenine methylase